MCVLLVLTRRDVRKYFNVNRLYDNGRGNAMNCGIVTGTKVLGVSNNGSAEDRSSTVLFDKNTSTRFSHVVSIDDCKALRLSAFNLSADDSITIHRVMLGGGAMAQGSGCCGCLEPASSSNILASEVFQIDCKPVKLTKCNGVLFLTVPGYYMFELNEEAKLGEVLAFAEPVDCCCLPSGLIIGNEKPQKYVGV